jgi:hypothetical protein
MKIPAEYPGAGAVVTDDVDSVVHGPFTAEAAIA